ncbi:MAG: WG repeat-containing protein [Clostridiales bacterium]|nr:WG repeat-containing protein [Clostridiales bacterium]
MKKYSVLIYLLAFLFIFSGCQSKPDIIIPPENNEQQQEEIIVPPDIPTRDPLAGEAVAPKWFESVPWVSLTGVTYRGLYGYVDIEGRLAIEPQYNKASVFSEGFAYAMRDGIHYIIDTKGNKTEITDARMQNIKRLRASKFSDGHILVLDEDCFSGEGWSYISTNGEVGLGANKWYSQKGSFSEGMTIIKSEGKWEYGYMDKKGDIVIEIQFCDAYSFHEGVAGVKESEDTLYGYIDKKGKYVIEPQFSDILSFSDGVAAATLDGELWGYINHDGKWLIEPQYKNISKFSEGLAVVDERYLIDKTGQVLADCVEKEFDEIHFYFEGILVAKQGDNVGCINEDFQWIIRKDTEEEWVHIDSIQPCENGLIFIGIDNYMYGGEYYNRKGLLLGFNSFW